MNLFTWKGDIDTVMKPIDSIVYCKMLLRNSLMSMDPTTGYIKAWVGGINFEHFKYDQVKTAPGRWVQQPNHLLMPWLLKTDFRLAWRWIMCLLPLPIPVSPTGCPRSIAIRNYCRVCNHLAHGIGSFAKLGYRLCNEQVGPVPVMELIKKMGITSPMFRPYPSICLGTFDARYYDMTGAYSVFANHGIWTEPPLLLRIEDKNGNVLYTHTPKVYRP